MALVGADRSPVCKCAVRDYPFIQIDSRCAVGQWWWGVSVCMPELICGTSSMYWCALCDPNTLQKQMYYNISIYSITNVRNKLAHTRQFSLCYIYIYVCSVFIPRFFLLSFAVFFFFFFFGVVVVAVVVIVVVGALRALSLIARSICRLVPKRKKYTFCTDIIHHSRSVSRRSRIQKLSHYAIKRLLCVLFVFLYIQIFQKKTRVLFSVATFFFVII